MNLTVLFHFAPDFLMFCSRNITSQHHLRKMSGTSFKIVRIPICLVYSFWFKIIGKCYRQHINITGRTKGAIIPPPPVPHFNIQTIQGLKILVSNIKDIDFNRFSEITPTRNSTIFTVYATIFGQFKAAFHFI